MANQVYPQGRLGICDRSIDLIGGTIKAALLDATPVFNAAHKFVVDVAAPAHIIARTAAVTTKALAITGGNVEWTCDDPTIAAVASGSTVKAVLLYLDVGGSDATSRIIGWVDTDQSAIAISLPTNGSDILVDMLGTGALEF